MSLPVFDTQGSLFGGLASISPGLFAENDRYRLFAQKIWPVLARSRPELEKCYCVEVCWSTKRPRSPSARCWRP